MADKKNKKAPKTGKQNKDKTQDLNNIARKEAEHDLDEDAEFTAHSPNDDLDEGETARLGEDKTGLV